MSNCYGTNTVGETRSYRIYLGRTEKAFEHRGIILVPSLSVSLPFR